MDQMQTIITKQLANYLFLASLLNATSIFTEQEMAHVVMLHRYNRARTNTMIVEKRRMEQGKRIGYLLLTFQAWRHLSWSLTCRT